MHRTLFHGFQTRWPRAPIALLVVAGIADPVAATSPSAGTMQALVRPPGMSSGSAEKMSSPLAGLVDRMRRGDGGGGALQTLGRPDGDGGIDVRVELSTMNDQALADLRVAGLDIVVRSDELAVARGRIRADRVTDLANLAVVRRLTLPRYSFTRTGAVTGRHDSLLGCEEIRNAFGVSGNGVRIGVISDGIDHVAESQSTGDAPAVTVPDDPRCHAGSGDEGSAIIELVHDCAPGAQIGFCGPLDDLEMVECLRCLRDVFQADVMVDDIGFLAQPFFEEGAVAREVQETVDRGVAYFTSAGNNARSHYQGPYSSCRGGQRHDFGNGDCTLSFSFSGVLLLLLQWDEPFGAAASNYDVCVAGQGCSEDVQDGDDDPVEGIGFACSGRCTGSLEIIQRSGVDHELELYLLRLTPGELEFLEHAVSTDSIFGHPCTEGAIAVAAIDASDPGLDTIEPFSSRGPCTFTRPSFLLRDKPDITGLDGIQHTGPGGFPSPFFGTSASAPGVAALATLLLEIDPRLTVHELRDGLLETAVDLGLPGRDFTFGAGRADGFAAAERVLPPCFSTPTPTTTPTGTATPSPTPGPCIGDCDADGEIVVNELIIGVRILLGNEPLTACPAMDANGDSQVTVNELVGSVNGALVGCVGG